MRTQAYLWFLGYQGGTIHQIADELGCEVTDLLHKKPSATHTGSDYSLGLYANTNSKEHRRKVLLPKYKGNLDYWLGVARCFEIMSLHEVAMTM